MCNPRLEWVVNNSDNYFGDLGNLGNFGDVGNMGTGRDRARVERQGRVGLDLGYTIICCISLFYQNIYLY